jgi:hypothetical protein
MEIIDLPSLHGYPLTTVDGEKVTNHLLRPGTATVNLTTLTTRILISEVGLLTFHPKRGGKVTVQGLESLLLYPRDVAPAVAQAVSDIHQLLLIDEDPGNHLSLKGIELRTRYFAQMSDLLF